MTLLFQIFLGQKHGFQPLQCTIAEEEFQKLRSALLKNNHDTSLIDQWYQWDDNSIPPVMVLQPISSLLSEDQVNLTNHVNDKWHKMMCG